MKNCFAVSNIAWDKHDDPEVLALLTRFGVTGIEVAPSKIWPELETLTEKEVRAYAAMLRDQGFRVPAFQAILYGHPELQVFDPETHPAFIRRLELVAKLANWMGAKVLVFGAPKNRRRRGLAYPEAFGRAAEFFHRAGETVKKYDCVLGIEANPVEYQCDFVTNTADAELLVKAADSAGVALHIDSGATAMTGENIREVLKARGIPFAHYHISEPMLGNVSGGAADHEAAFRTLKELNYGGAVSIEMKMQSPELENLGSALRYVKEAMKHAAF